MKQRFVNYCIAAGLNRTDGQLLFDHIEQDLEQFRKMIAEMTPEKAQTAGGAAPAA
jgi:hypothetical protein